MLIPAVLGLGTLSLLSCSPSFSGQCLSFPGITIPSAHFHGDSLWPLCGRRLQLLPASWLPRFQSPSASPPNPLSPRRRGWSSLPSSPGPLRHSLQGPWLCWLGQSFPYLPFLPCEVSIGKDRKAVNRSCEDSESTLRQSKTQGSSLSETRWKVCDSWDTLVPWVLTRQL